MEWIRTASLDDYDVISAFEEFDSLYWKKSNFSIEPGDIVYIYVGRPISKIMYKTVCVKNNVMSSDEEGLKDLKYWKNGKTPDKAYESINLKLISINNSNDLNIKQLNDLGLVKGNIQGAYKETKYPDLFKHINNVFNSLDGIQNVEAYVSQIEEGLTGTFVGKEKETIVKQRVNQGKYRNLLLNKYKKCCLCGVQNDAFLIASHIKPWAKCDENEKVDVNNGLLLCPNHDALFDGGYISFEDDGSIIISKELDEVDEMFLNVRKNMKISVSDEQKKYLKYHRDNLFK